MSRGEIQKYIHAVLDRAGSQPRHRFGQNFMVEPASLRAVIEAGQLTSEDFVLEIGSGPGNLTRLIAAVARSVLAVDIDRLLLPAAQAQLSDMTNITWLCEDALETKHRLSPALLSQITALRQDRPVKLLANLPYNIASPLIVILLSHFWRQIHSLPDGFDIPRMAFTVQLEVAHRMAARINTAAYGGLTVMIASIAAVKIIRPLGPGHFWPAPKVDSALVEIIPDPALAAQITDFAFLELLVARLFSHRRQRVLNALRHSFNIPPEILMADLVAADVPPDKRPGELAPSEFCRLATRLQPRVN